MRLYEVRVGNLRRTTHASLQLRRSRLTNNEGKKFEFALLVPFGELSELLDGNDEGRQRSTIEYCFVFSLRV